MAPHQEENRAVLIVCVCANGQTGMNGCVHKAAICLVVCAEITVVACNTMIHHVVLIEVARTWGCYIFMFISSHGAVPADRHIVLR